ncbi:EKC/KEOPS complex subunit BUD32 [Fusarium sp. Ph1]|nr:EKC/KEOPS complex subunit BUD32 [Fusarium sp. Ph1]
MDAQRITDVYPFQGRCAFNVDFQHKEFRVCWTGSWLKPPNLDEFPSLAEQTGATIEQILHSSAVDAIWSRSRAIAHGANSHIRLLADSLDDFPICKVAIDNRQRQMIPKARVVQTSAEPLQDEDGIFGFRMMKLKPITHDEVSGYYHDILEVLRHVHDAGVVHYDLSWTNIMLDQDGQVTLIDFGHAGLSEADIPLHKRRKSTRDRHQKYLASYDLEVLKGLQRYE